MKYIKTFESHSEEINHLTELEKGDEVAYAGSRYEVLEVDEYHAVLKSKETDKETMINQAQLNQYGMRKIQ